MEYNYDEFSKTAEDSKDVMDFLNEYEKICKKYNMIIKGIDSYDYIVNYSKESFDDFLLAFDHRNVK